MNEWQQEWKPTEIDNRLHELATRYHTECEAYDQTVCTGPMGQDGIMPANPRETALINRNAHTVRKRLTEEAEREGIGREELARAISKWNGSLPNVELTGAAASLSPQRPATEGARLSAGLGVRTAARKGLIMMVKESSMEPTDEELLQRGFSPAAIAMRYGETGSNEYYEALKRLGGFRTQCPYCGNEAMGTGDCDCYEED